MTATTTPEGMPLGWLQCPECLAGANLSRGPQLHRVVMPLVRLLCTDELSWSNREKVADAISNALRHHQSMAAERAHLLGALGSASSAQGWPPAQEPAA